MEFLKRWLAETGSVPGDRPLVTLSYAQTLDGSISLRRHQRLAISAEQAQVLTHKLRASHDAILVGIGTVLSDDPQLNVRLAEGNDPQVVVLDSNLRMPSSSKILKAKKMPWVFYSADAPKESYERLSRAGVRLEKQDKSGPLDLQMILSRLKEMGINKVMVEGGGKVIAAFLAAGLVDRLVLTIAPRIVDGYRIPLDLAKPLDLINAHVEQVGEDTVIFGKFRS